jgi:hypothetical protein
MGCRVWGVGKECLPHTLQVLAPTLMYGLKKKMSHRSDEVEENSVSLFETPDFNYGVPHSLQPTPYTLSPTPLSLS